MTIEKVYDELYGMIDDLKKQIAAAAGSDVTITPALESGTKVADYTIGEDEGALYAPTIPNIFSGDEVLVGNDGTNDIYCKRVDIQSLPSTPNTATPVAHGISNISSIVKFDGYAILPTGLCIKINGLSISDSGTFNSTGAFVASVDSTNINFKVGADQSTVSGIFYIYYTKTSTEAKKTTKKK